MSINIYGVPVNKISRLALNLHHSWKVVEQRARRADWFLTEFLTNENVGYFILGWRIPGDGCRVQAG